MYLWFVRSFVRSLPAMELPSSQTPFCAAPKAGPRTTHTHTCTHTPGVPMVGQYQIFKVAFPRPPLQPTFSLTHRHIRTYTHILSLSLPLSFSIIAHDARTINESSTVNKKGRKQKVVWCFTYSSRSSRRSSSRRRGGEEVEEE